MFTELARHPNIGLRYAAVTTTNSDSSIRLPVAFVTVEMLRRNFGDRQSGRAFRNLGRSWAARVCVDSRSTSVSTLQERQFSADSLWAGTTPEVLDVALKIFAKRKSRMWIGLVDNVVNAPLAALRNQRNFKFC
jgi:hypothetical protein